MTNQASELLPKPRAESPALDRAQIDRPPQVHHDVGREGDRDREGRVSEENRGHGTRGRAGVAGRFDAQGCE